MEDTKERLGAYLALLHFPVYNKNGDIVTTALTNLDIHDIARVAKTFGIKRYFVVTPAETQQELLEKILGHWMKGFGADYNPERKDALGLVKGAYSLEDVVEEIEATEKQRPLLVATSARENDVQITCEELREKISQNLPLLIIFGTGWGLAKEVIERADYILEPIRGTGQYNHLAVRSAAAIILDRLFGR